MAHVVGEWCKNAFLNRSYTTCTPKETEVIHFSQAMWEKKRKHSWGRNIHMGTDYQRSCLGCIHGLHTSWNHTSFFFFFFIRHRTTPTQAPPRSPHVPCICRNRCCGHARTSDGRDVIATEAQATYTILSNRIVSIPVTDTDSSRPGYPPLKRMRGMHTGARGKQLRCKKYRYESRVIKN